ncbi:inositol monophosphatase family protein [Actinomadura atramentaria]|uniref:inositol monophosphatase family protein n=1 Tax=Actinomadura atramentaria TaxID=1990 RepID=UPI00037CCCE5|nr:inositol monophosphatase family protein [Actinomadura atramentaria]
MSTPEELLDLAVRTARAAGRMLVEDRPAAGPDVVQTKSSPTDVVTQMDRAAEKLIIERIRAERPDDAFLGEEGGESAGASGVRWVIDPIDGTVNYLYDLPDWAVSIAAERDGTAVAGAVVLPRRGELFTATLGGGAFLESAAGRRRLHVNADVPLASALVATGFGYSAARRAHQARVLTGVVPHVRDIRRGGSACNDLCALAAGRVDAYYERGVQAWDVAAGALIVTEAGGRVEGLNGAPTSPEFAMAAGPGTFEALHALLAPLDPAHD